MEKVEQEKFIVSCHRQQQELLSSLLDRVWLGSWHVCIKRGVSRQQLIGVFHTNVILVDQATPRPYLHFLIGNAEVDRQRPLDQPQSLVIYYALATVPSRRYRSLAGYGTVKSWPVWLNTSPASPAPLATSVFIHIEFWTITYEVIVGCSCDAFSVVTVSHLARSVDFGSVLWKKPRFRYRSVFTTQQQSVVTAPAAAVTK